MPHQRGACLRGRDTRLVLTQPPRVDCRGLLGNHPGVHAADFNVRTKAGGTSRRGCGAASQVDRGSCSVRTTTATFELVNQLLDLFATVVDS